MWIESYRSMPLIRLQKILALAGLGSRRKCEVLILQGRVRVNQTLVQELGTKADPSQDRIYLDDELIHYPIHYDYYLLNKPKGYLVTKQDTHQRKTIFDLLPSKLRHLNPVGRLDLESRGLLLLTNDGNLIQRLLHPRYKVLKKYRVTVTGNITSHVIAQLRKGVLLEDSYQTQPAYVKIIEQNLGQTVLEFHLSEGKKRQIRRMCQQFHLKVLDLYRFAFGTLEVKNIPEGKYRPLSKKEWEEFI